MAVKLGFISMAFPVMVSIYFQVYQLNSIDRKFQHICGFILCLEHKRIILETKVKP
jgi:hypothetical protein